MDSVTWEGFDHPHEVKQPEWYVIKWIVATATALVCIIFGNILLGLLVVVATGTLSLLAARPLQHHQYGVHAHGVSISNHTIPYTAMHGYEFVDRGGEHLLVIDTKQLRHPHVLIAVPEEHVESARALFNEYAKEVPRHTRGVPLSHTLMEIVGL